MNAAIINAVRARRSWRLSTSAVPIDPWRDSCSWSAVVSDHVEAVATSCVEMRTPDDVNSSSQGRNIESEGFMGSYEKQDQSGWVFVDGGYSKGEP